MTWTITIPRCIPSRNQTKGEHWGSRQRQIKAWANDIAVLALAHRIPKATGKRRIRITRLMGKGQKRYDEDNHDIKALVDSLKPAKIALGSKAVPGVGLVVDDSPRYLDIVLPVVDERAADGKPGTRIEISEVTND